MDLSTWLQTTRSQHLTVKDILDLSVGQTIDVVEAMFMRHTKCAEPADLYFPVYRITKKATDFPLEVHISSLEEGIRPLRNHHLSLECTPNDFYPCRRGRLSRSSWYHFNLKDTNLFDAHKYRLGVNDYPTSTRIGVTEDPLVRIGGSLPPVHEPCSVDMHAYYRQFDADRDANDLEEYPNRRDGSHHIVGFPDQECEMIANPNDYDYGYDDDHHRDDVSESRGDGHSDAEREFSETDVIGCCCEVCNREDPESKQLDEFYSRHPEPIRWGYRNNEPVSLKMDDIEHNECDEMEYRSQPDVYETYAKHYSNRKLYCFCEMCTRRYSDQDL